MISNDRMVGKASFHVQPYPLWTIEYDGQKDVPQRVIGWATEPMEVDENVSDISNTDDIGLAIWAVTAIESLKSRPSRLFFDSKEEAEDWITHDRYVRTHSA